MVVIRPNVSLHAVGRGATFFREKTDPLLACPPSWESWLTGHLPVSLLHGLSVRPPTDLVFVVFRGLPGQTIVLSLVGSSNCLVSFGGLVERRLVVRRHCAPLVGCWEWGLNEETPTSWGRLPLASSYSPGGSGVVVHSLGWRSGPTLPHCEAEVSGVGSP